MGYLEKSISEQEPLWAGTDYQVSFTLHGCEYVISNDATRAHLKPSWYVQRMTDLRTTKRYYSWPDGAFSAVVWGRAEWED